MANTLKFGNENWATKKDSILAYNDENANFKPLPFATSRASTATRVNKAGLIETVASGIPRVDYLGNTKGAYLLEPQSTNLIARSEAFASSYWTKSGASIEGDASTAGVEKVVNGDFASDSNWTKGAGTTISGGSANFSSATAVSLYQSVSATVNSLVTFNVTNYVSGVLNVYLGGSESVSTQNVSANGNGNYTVLLDFNTGNGNIIFGSSNSFTGSIDNVSIKEVSGFASPSADSPLGAFKLVESATNASHFIYSGLTYAVATGNDYTYSVLAKKGENNFLQVILSSVAFSSTAYANFDLLNGVIGTIGAGVTAKIKSLANGWFKISVTHALLGTGSHNSLISLIDSATSVRNQSRTGDGTSGVYIFGAQIEESSYASSYIPTNGSTVTRLVDTATGAGNASTFNSEEGVLYAEMAALADDETYRSISVKNAPNFDDIALIRFNGISNQISAIYAVGGVTSAILLHTTNTLNYHKIAFRYSLNNFSLWVDGVKVSEDLSGNVSLPNSLDSVNFNLNSPTQNFYGKVNDLRVYNTSLTDAELVTLTKV